MPLSWLDVRDILNKAPAHFLAQPAAVGAHPGDLFPLFVFVPLAEPSHLAYLSHGEALLLDVPAGSYFLSTARTCHVCHCTELDCSGCIDRTGVPCHWVGPALCSACATPCSPVPAVPPARKTSLVRALAPIS